MTGLSLSDDDRYREPERRRGLGLLLVLLLLAILALGYVAQREWRRADATEAQLAALARKTDEAAALAQRAMDTATLADSNARGAAFARRIAEEEAAGARQEATTAKQEADTFKQQAMTAAEQAAKAQAEAEAIKKRAEADIDRLQKSLGTIAETRRTALGLVMNLGGDHLKFEFDKAELSAADRELLSRIAGILVTADDYTISVNGHTDDVGSDAYNRKLSERRAQAVRDYLVKAGLSPEILSVTGHGKSLPLVPGTSDAARAKNRRVELAIANTQIRYARP
jgi:outer membrane protein OmpA-like peptidoglycan-associated protein